MVTEYDKIDSSY